MEKSDQYLDGREHPEEREPRKFLGIHFRCCNVYSRIYKSRDGTVYEGRCPRCGTAVRVPIGSGGSSNRFFTAE